MCAIAGPALTDEALLLFQTGANHQTGSTPAQLPTEHVPRGGSASHAPGDTASSKQSGSTPNHPSLPQANRPQQETGHPTQPGQQFKSQDRPNGKPDNHVTFPPEQSTRNDAEIQRIDKITATNQILGPQSTNAHPKPPSTPAESIFEITGGDSGIRMQDREEGELGNDDDCYDVPKKTQHQSQRSTPRQNQGTPTRRRYPSPYPRSRSPARRERIMESRTIEKNVTEKSDQRSHSHSYRSERGLPARPEAGPGRRRVGDLGYFEVDRRRMSERGSYDEDSRRSREWSEERYRDWSRDRSDRRSMGREISDRGERSSRRRSMGRDRDYSREERSGSRGRSASRGRDFEYERSGPRSLREGSRRYGGR